MALAIVALFIFYLAARNRLPRYMQVLGLAQGSGTATTAGATPGTVGGTVAGVGNAALSGASGAVNTAANKLVSNFFANSPLGSGDFVASPVDFAGGGDYGG